MQEATLAFAVALTGASVVLMVDTWLAARREGCQHCEHCRRRAYDEREKLRAARHESWHRDRAMAANVRPLAECDDPHCDGWK